MRRSRFRDALVAVQVAASLVLLAAAGTLVASLRQLASSTTGLDVRGAVLVEMGVPASGHVSAALARARSTYAGIVAREPEVVATARALSPPFTPWSYRGVLAGADSSSTTTLAYNAVTPRYFDVVGQRIVRGRGFSSRDSVNDARVVVITQSAAQRLWPGANAVGRTLRLVDGDQPPLAYEVIGVANDAHSGMVWDFDDNGYVFVPLSPGALVEADQPLLVRAGPDVAPLRRRLEDLARQVDPDSPVRIEPVTAGLATQLLPFQYGAGVAAAIGVLGLVLATVGLYGIVSFAVAQRRRDLAVHVALGATPRDVLRLVLRHEMRLVLIGLGIGLAAATIMTRVIATMVLTVTPLGVPGLAALVAALGLVASAATAMPALRALRIAPMQVLRQE